MGGGVGWMGIAGLVGDSDDCEDDLVKGIRDVRRYETIKQYQTTSPYRVVYIYTHSFILSLSRETSVNDITLQSSSTFVSLDTGRSHCLVPSRGRLGSVAKNPIKSFPNIPCEKWVLFVDLWISRKQKRDSDSVSGCMSEVWLLLAPAVYLVGKNLAHIINIKPKVNNILTITIVNRDSSGIQICL